MILRQKTFFDIQVHSTPNLSTQVTGFLILPQKQKWWMNSENRFCVNNNTWTNNNIEHRQGKVCQKQNDDFSF